MTVPRVAFFTDSFHEVNGVARTSREFARFARNANYPFFSVHTGPRTACWTEGNLTTCELKLSWASVRLETDLFLDLLVLRHLPRLRRALRQFRPELIHVTGPGHLGLLGAIVAYDLKVPLVASWHTNVHEYGAKRLATLLRRFPARLRSALCGFLEWFGLNLILWPYHWARLLFAPNPELVNMLLRKTGHPTHLMGRGIDTDLFSPAQRRRADDEFVIGYVGRLSSEKDVRVLAALEKRLIAAGTSNYRFLIVGGGDERDWLAANLQRRNLPGVLRGMELARAYADMDVFVFPSRTDTFGNVVLEAMASGVPPVVSMGGGPKYIIRPGVDGYAEPNIETCAQSVLALHHNPALRHRMAANARQRALTFSWEAVFRGVYAKYEEALSSGVLRNFEKSRFRLPGRAHQVSIRNS